MCCRRRLVCTACFNIKLSCLGKITTFLYLLTISYCDCIEAYTSFKKQKSWLAWSTVFRKSFELKSCLLETKKKQEQNTRRMVKLEAKGWHDGKWWWRVQIWGVRLVAAFSGDWNRGHGFMTNSLMSVKKGARFVFSLACLTVRVNAGTGRSKLGL